MFTHFACFSYSYASVPYAKPMNGVCDELTSCPEKTRPWQERHVCRPCVVGGGRDYFPAIGRGVQ